MLHLLHPALLHYSIAFIGVGGACEVAGILARREAWARFGGTLLLIGLVALVPTMVSGYLAANTTTATGEAELLLERHERLAWILLLLLLGAQFWKAWNRGELAPGPRKVYALLVAAAWGLTLWVAWLGGQMVYVQGVGVR